MLKVERPDARQRSEFSVQSSAFLFGGVVKNVVFSLVLLATSELGIDLHASEAMKAIVDSYLEIQSQLAADKIDGVKGPAGAIAEQASRMGQAGASVEKAARALERAPDLKTARDAFGPLSDAVVAAGKAEGWKDISDVKLAYCPMIKRSWLQKEDRIRNPYFGSTMPECGEFRPTR